MQNEKDGSVSNEMQRSKKLAARTPFFMILDELFRLTFSSHPCKILSMKVLKSLHHLPLQASPEANNIAIVLRPKATDTRRGGHEDLNCPTWADNSP